MKLATNEKLQDLYYYYDSQAVFAELGMVKATRYLNEHSDSSGSSEGSSSFKKEWPQGQNEENELIYDTHGSSKHTSNGFGSVMDLPQEEAKATLKVSTQLGKQRY